MRRRARPTVQLRGLIDLGGTGSVGSPSGSSCMFCLQLAAWSNGSDSLHVLQDGERPTTIEYDVTERSLSRLMKLYKPLGAVYARGRWIAAPDGNRRFHASSIRRVAPDPEMQRIAAQLRKPVRQSVPGLGRLTLKRCDNGAYSTRIAWGRRQVMVDLDVDQTYSLAALLASVRGIWRRQFLWNKRIRESLLRWAFPAWKNTWRLEGDPALSKRAFLSRASLYQVGFSSGGVSFVVAFPDDLFGGHHVHLMGSVSIGITEWELIG